MATGVVDAKRVGIHGHSWGGYQTAFLITQTNMFHAAVAGAPLTDMIAMYNADLSEHRTANQADLREQPGPLQRRVPQDNLEAYIRNSPVYHAKNVTTPLMILHNDKDGAVDLTQGIEYFNTLRRHVKAGGDARIQGRESRLAEAGEHEGLHGPDEGVLRSPAE